MKRQTRNAAWGCLLCMCIAVVSCTGMAPEREVHRVNALNREAYRFRYRNLDSLHEAATQAERSVRFYRSGKAEACNNQAFHAFMQMDYEKAERLYHAVYEQTRNELELLVADIGLMRVYQRTAMNKEFYDSRISALRRMERIAEDDALFVEGHGRERLDYARGEFYLVSAVYYYYLQQRPEALECIRQVPEVTDLSADTSQWLHYHYVRGAAGLVDGQTEEERSLREFDELYATWLTASRTGFLYFEAAGVQGLAELMATDRAYKFFLDRRGHALERFGLPVDTLLPLRLGQLALRKFVRYGDVYQQAGTYVSIGRYLNEHGRYREALDTLQTALDCVNKHHQQYYHCNDSLDRLKMFDRRDAVPVEQEWMKHKLKTVPEWISRIREQLSVAYAGLGRKECSDYNRNIYLDILDDTRQDKELESRYEALERGMHQLNLWSMAVVAGIVTVLVFFWFFNRRSKERNRRHLRRLQCLLDVGQKITASIPADARTEEEVADAICRAVADDMESLFGTKDFHIENRELTFPHLHMGRDEVAILKILNPYVQWALENGMATITLGDEHRRLEKQRYIYERHIADNKRRNLEKKACLAIVNGIYPYIDRLANEAGKLTRKGLIPQAEVRAEKYQYMDELVTTINEYNDILALWIKMKQGALSLHVENFGLDELFALLDKGKRVFDMRRQTFEVVPTDACVKADRALTLFMLNTLVENARKYTPEGGCVKVYAECREDYVEISVEDTGRGLSREDVLRLTEEKIYDPKVIGMNDDSDREELKKSKGSGFGLMNCRGIIEKYRKTNALFGVCKFGIESELGRGSRFYFRLPVGVRKALTLLVLLLSLGLTSCGEEKMRVEETSSVQASDELLLWASDYANAAYYSNIDRRYEQTLAYVDSAIWCLNEHAAEYGEDRAEKPMTLTGKGSAAELQWWDAWFDTDYHVILDIRNEAAVAFMALKRWDAYRYNNDAYTALYKLLGEDQSLEEYCRRLERSAGNRTVGIWLTIFLFLALILGYYFLYFRKRLVDRWNLEQVLEIDSLVFKASRPATSVEVESGAEHEEAALGLIPRRIVDETFHVVNELVGIDRLGIAIYNEETHRLDYVCNPRNADGADSGLMEQAERCMETQRPVFDDSTQMLPLLVEAGGVKRCIGVLHLERRQGEEQESDLLLLELVARYLAIVLFNAVVKLATKYRDIELAEDEVRRASYEDSQLHVQNMVLDNCLSTIKHETLYYPNRIKQLVGKLRSRTLDAASEAETVAAVRELAEYYRGIFALLSSCAARQLEEVTFRRSVIPVSVLTEAAGNYFHKAVKNCRAAVTLTVETTDAQVVGDVDQLRFLLESLVDEALAWPAGGELRLAVVADGPFVRFSFTDTRRNRSQEELNQLFYPSLERMTSGEDGRLRGTEYLIGKQIIRDHDEYAGRRGCRIDAETTPDGRGFTVSFTIPRK